MLKNQLVCCTAIAFLLAAEVTLNLTPGSGRCLNLAISCLVRALVLSKIILDAWVSRKRIGWRVYFFPNRTQVKKLGLFVPSR